MSTYTQLCYHIIFSTFKRNKSLRKSDRDELFRYISKILENKKCHLYWIDGVEDHIHIATHIHQTITLASLVKDIKLAADNFIKHSKIFPAFDGWQNGYGAVTFSYRDKDDVINYIKNQEEHQREKTFKEELIEFYVENGIEFNEKYLF